MVYIYIHVYVYVNMYTHRSKPITVLVDLSNHTPSYFHRETADSHSRDNPLYAAFVLFTLNKTLASPCCSTV